MMRNGRRRPKAAAVASDPSLGASDPSLGASDPSLGASDPSLGKTAARGAAVTLGGQGLRMIIQVASVVILAKLLTPREYGLVAEVLAIAGLADIFRDFGLSAAAVQAKTLSRGQRDNLFWTNGALGIALGGLIVGCSGLISAFYSEPSVARIAQVLAVVFVFNGLATQYRADLNRRLRFGLLAAVDISAQGAGLVLGLVMALLGAGYWALVGMQIFNAVWTLVLLASFARWLPGRYRRGEDMSKLLRFGWRLVATQVVGYATNNVDNLIVGHRFGAAPLGVYSRGFQLLMAPLTQIRAPTTTVALPVLSRIEDDRDQYSAFLIRGQVGLGYSLVAGLAIVGAAAQPIVDLFLGGQWHAVTPILRVLALAGAVTTLSYVGYWVFLSRALTKELLRFTVFTLVLRIVCVIVGSNWGIVGVSIGYAFAPAISAPLSLWWLSRMTPLPVVALIQGYTRIVAVAIIAALTGWGVLALIPRVPSAVAILVGAVVVAAVYGLAFVIAPGVRRDMRDMHEVSKLVRQR